MDFAVQENIQHNKYILKWKSLLNGDMLFADNSEIITPATMKLDQNLECLATECIVHHFA